MKIPSIEIMFRRFFTEFLDFTRIFSLEKIFKLIFHHAMNFPFFRNFQLFFRIFRSKKNFHFFSKKKKLVFFPLELPNFPLKNSPRISQKSQLLLLKKNHKKPEKTSSQVPKCNRKRSVSSPKFLLFFSFFQTPERTFCWFFVTKTDTFSLFFGFFEQTLPLCWLWHRFYDFLAFFEVFRPEKAEFRHFLIFGISECRTKNFQTQTSPKKCQIWI